MSVRVNQKINKTPKNHPGILIPLGIFLFSVTLFFINSRYLWLIVVNSEDKIFGADTSDIVNLIRNVTFDGDTRKHLLFSLTMSPLAGFFRQIIGLNDSRSIRLAMAVIAAMNVTGVYLFLKIFMSSALPALLFTGFYAFFFANFVIFSIPETYSVSNLTILLYFVGAYKWRNALNWYNCLLLSIIAGFASLYNPTLLSLILIHSIMLLSHVDIKRWIMITITGIALGAGIFLFANTVTYGLEFFHYVDNFAGKWASLENFLDFTKLLDVFSNFFFFSILSPVDYLPKNLDFNDWIFYGQSFSKILLIPLIAGFLGYGIYLAITKKNGHRVFRRSLLAWIFFMILFFTYFNPRDAILYSNQVLFPMLLIFVQAFESLTIKQSQKYLVFLVIFLMIAIHNSLTFYNGIQ